MRFHLEQPICFFRLPTLVGRLAFVLWLSISCGSLIAQDEEAAEEEELPTLEEMKSQLPGFDELMAAKPYDWIVLREGGVFVAEPVYPRPDTLKKMALEKIKLEETRPANRVERDRVRNRLNQLREIEIYLPDNQTEQNRLSIGAVSQIISFEKIMLWRVDELLKNGEIAKAYEMLLVVDRNAPNWEETTPRFDALLLREADLKLQADEPYAALALMDELAERNLANSTLPVVMGKTIDGLIQRANEREDFSKVQYLIDRLAKYYPDHPVSRNWTERLQQLSQRRLTEAGQLAQQGQHREAALTAAEAIRAWSNLDTSQAAESARYLSRYQTLRVPVRRFSGEKVVMPVPLDAEARHGELTSVRIFEPFAADELTYFQSSFFDVWEPTDLGREVVFTLKQTRPYFQSQPILSANQIAGMLSNQLNKNTSSFSPRLASFVKSFSVRSPTELQVSFTRVPLNLEAMFRFPVYSEITDQDSEPRLLSTKFQVVDSDDRRRIYRRIVPEPDGLIPSQYHVAEIVEQKFPDRHSEIQAFQRGNVDILPTLRPWEIDVFKASGLAFVQQYAIPSTHVIVFNPKSEATRSAQLRRGLSFGVDREGMLKKVILRDPEMKYGRVTSAPWHSGSYANSPLVDPPQYDHYLSFLLRLAAQERLRIPEKQKFVAEAKARTLAAKEEWDEEQFRFDNSQQIKAVAEHIKLPKLRLVCDPDDVAMLAAKQMVDRWGKLGYEIELIPGNQAGETLGDDDWDMMYRRVRMQEPLLDLWELLLTDTAFDVDRLSGYPDWMRQELINLDYATSFKDAQERLFLIHRHMAAQAFLIPLWELDDFVALQRQNVTGFAARPLSVYHNVERWLVKP